MRPVADSQLRAQAVKAGLQFHMQLIPALRGEIANAATNAYSAAWEGSQGRVMDHQAALQAAIAAAAPLLIADHYARLNGPPTLTLEQLVPGMVVKIPVGQPWWARISHVGPSVALTSTENTRSAQVVSTGGMKAGTAYNLTLYQGAYEIKPGQHHAEIERR